MASKLNSTLKALSPDVIVVGAGLAGSECAWQLLKSGFTVALIEQRPVRQTEAHTTGGFAELVCSNSFKSTDVDAAPQVLKDELRRMNSLILKAADEARIPAGQSLGVDRNIFSSIVTKTLEKQPNLKIVRDVVESYQDLIVSGARGIVPVILATGPLTGESLAKSLAELIGEQLYFYDAIAPIVTGESIDRSIAFMQNRYDKNTEEGSEGDYLNCPMTEPEYYAFIEALGSADKVQPHDFEKAVYFQGCQPIEAMLERGPRTLSFGPMKPVGLIDSRTGKQSYAVVQLRKEDAEGRAWNMVGFQTKLKYGEQKRIFQMIPGLQNAEFYRFGSLHRNTYINSPAVLDTGFRLKNFPAIHFAGQVTGVEGYMESTAVGALVGRSLALRLRGLQEPPLPPDTTATGALAHAICFGKVKNFQPMNINWGLVPLKEINERDKEKKTKMVARAQRHFGHWLALFP